MGICVPFESEVRFVWTYIYTITHSRQEEYATSYYFLDEHLSCALHADNGVIEREATMRKQRRRAHHFRISVEARRLGAALHRTRQ